MQVVADTSALVSLGITATRNQNPLDHLLAEHRVAIPERVITELRETAGYDDASGEGARRTLERRTELDVHSVELDETFPLDTGENAAVSLANDMGATQFLCDEFNQLALIHASLTGSRLVTTPTLLVLLTRQEVLSRTDAEQILTAISDARSWAGNSYVERARTTLKHQ